MIDKVAQCAVKPVLRESARSRSETLGLLTQANYSDQCAFLRPEGGLLKQADFRRRWVFGTGYTLRMAEDQGVMPETVLKNKCR